MKNDFHLGFDRLSFPQTQLYKCSVLDMTAAILSQQSECSHRYPIPGRGKNWNDTICLRLNTQSCYRLESLIHPKLSWLIARRVLASVAALSHLLIELNNFTDMHPELVVRFDELSFL